MCWCCVNVRGVGCTRRGRILVSRKGVKEEVKEEKMGEWEEAKKGEWQEEKMGGWACRI
jgi:hypothetical protein